MAGMALSASVATASISNKEDHFFCDFSSVDDFNAWTTVDVNGWQGSEDNPGNCWVYSWDYMSPFIGCWYEDVDDWLFSPKVSLTGGKEYVVKIKIWADYPCQIQVTTGKDAKPESQKTLSEVEVLDGSYYRTYTVPASAAISGGCYFGIHATTQAIQDGYLFIQSFEVVDNRDGSIAFTLVNRDSGKPLSDVELHLSGATYEERSETTDASGKATFTSLTPGTYSVRYDIPGLVNTDPVEVVVADKAAVNHRLEAYLPPLVSVGATVVDYLGRPLADANVTLSSSVKTFTATTGADGTFTMNDVYGNETYAMTVSKFLKADYNQELKLTDKNVTLSTITLDNYFDKPSGVAADLTENGMFVSWMVPLGKKEFKHDAGRYAGMYTTNGRDYVRYGVVFDEPMSVEEVNWVVAELTDEQVDVGVYLRDSEGRLSTTPAFEAKGVKSDTYNWDGVLNWQSYVLDKPVDAPYGCVVSVGHALGADLGFAICTDYVECWTSVEAHNDFENGWTVANSFVGHFLIRANGTVLSRNVAVAPKAASSLRVSSDPVVARAPMMLEGIGFDVWRVEGDNVEGTADDWTSVATDVRSLYAIDSEFKTQPQGTYRYAVQAVSHNGTRSEIAFSKPFAHKLSTDFYLAVYTNTAVELANGAVVTLKSADVEGLSYVDVVADNHVQFSGIPKGTYLLTIEKYGFATFSQNVNLGSQSSYGATAELNLSPLAPFALKASQAENSNEVVLTWNGKEGIFEDFEDMEDFAINPAGKLGWTYADVDQGTTYGVNQCQQTPYPNMHSPMAFQAFNPSATTPDITEYVQPYSGKKVLVDVSQENTERNDDYLFSPELSFDGPFTFSFHAASGFFGLLGNEEFMVGYTTGAPEPANVVWITESPVAVGGMWTEFTYDMPAKARHAVIRCVSKDCLFFMLDDIFIGRVEPDVFAMTSFKVEVDGENAGTTASRSISIADLEPGKHIAKVQTVYTMVDATHQYSDFAEIVFNVADKSSLDAIEAGGNLYVYDRASFTLAAGEQAVALEVFDMQGRMLASGSGVIDLSGVAPGVMVVRVHTAAGTVETGRIIR